MRIALVGCGKSKLDRSAPARDLYTGPLFQKARAYAEVHCDAWYILSARHWAVSPSRVLEPYEARLDSRTKQERYAWGCSAGSSLCKNMVEDGHTELQMKHGILTYPEGENHTLVMLAGSTYVDLLLPRLEGKPFTIEDPMRGMGIGHRLRWLGNAAQTELFTRSRRTAS